MKKFDLSALTTAERTKHVTMLKENGMIIDAEGNIVNIPDELKGFTETVNTSINNLSYNESYNEDGEVTSNVIVNIEKPIHFLSIQTGKMEEMHNIYRNGSFVDMLTDVGVDDDIDIAKLNDSQRRKVLRVLSKAVVEINVKNINNDKDGWNTLQQIAVEYDNAIAERIEKMYAKFVSDTNNSLLK